MSKPVTVIATYRVKKGEEDAFRAYLSKHWPTLREHDLTTEDPPSHLPRRGRGSGAVLRGGIRLAGSGRGRHRPPAPGSHGDLGAHG